MTNLLHSEKHVSHVLLAVGFNYSFCWGVLWSTFTLVSRIKTHPSLTGKNCCLGRGLVLFKEQEIVSGLKNDNLIDHSVNYSPIRTLPETDIAPEIMGWKTKKSLWDVIVSGTILFHGGYVFSIRSQHLKCKSAF